MGRIERHGGILQTMLSKYELEHEITNYSQLQQALAQCTMAKNTWHSTGVFPRNGIPQKCYCLEQAHVLQVRYPVMMTTIPCQSLRGNTRGT